MGLLIKNGTLLTADGRTPGDLRCRDGRIVEVGAGLEPAGEEVLDAAGAYVFPGGVDPHVHMALPVAGTVSADDFATGTAAALAGGTTTIVDFVHPERGDDFLAALRARREEAAAAVCDYAFHMAVTWWGEGPRAAIRQCIESEGVPTFKAYLAYKATVGIDDGELLEAMAAIAAGGGRLLAHCEHGEATEYLRARFAAAGETAPRFHALSRPAALEGEATWRAATLAATTGAELYVVHVTCADSADAVRRARALGWPVRGETCPQYLLLDDSVYERPGVEGAAFVCAPPIRPRGHQGALWKALEDGTLEAIGTDHCPFTLEQKRLGAGDFRLIPGGLAGVEHRLSLLWTHGVGAGRLTPERFVDLVSTRPAQLMGLHPRKGSLAAGSDADLVVWDPEATATISAATHHHRCDHTPYEGFEVRGLPAIVVAGGEVRYRDGQIRAEPGCGRFQRRALPRGPDS
jgi:dihydropyrimidinase